MEILQKLANFTAQLKIPCSMENCGPYWLLPYVVDLCLEGYVSSLVCLLVDWLCVCVSSQKNYRWVSVKFLEGLCTLLLKFWGAIWSFEQELTGPTTDNYFSDGLCFLQMDYMCVRICDTESVKSQYFKVSVVDRSVTCKKGNNVSRVYENWNSFQHLMQCFSTGVPQLPWNQIEKSK